MPRFLSKTTMRKAVDGAPRRSTGRATKRVTARGVRLLAPTVSDGNRVRAALTRFGIEATYASWQDIFVPYALNVKRARAKRAARRNPRVGVCLGCGKRKRLAYATPEGGVCRETACVKRAILPRVAAEHARDALDALGTEPEGVLCAAGRHRNAGSWLDYARETGSCPRCEVECWRARGRTAARRNPRYVHPAGDDLGVRYRVPSRAERVLVRDRAREGGDTTLAVLARLSLGESLAGIARADGPSGRWYDEAVLAETVLARGSDRVLWTKARAVAAVAKAAARAR